MKRRVRLAARVLGPMVLVAAIHWGAWSAQAGAPAEGAAVPERVWFGIGMGAAAVALLLGLAIWAWALLDLCWRQFPEGFGKDAWFLVIFLTGIVGAAIYLDYVRPKGWLTRKPPGNEL